MDYGKRANSPQLKSLTVTFDDGEAFDLKYTTSLKVADVRRMAGGLQDIDTLVEYVILTVKEWSLTIGRKPLLIDKGIADVFLVDDLTFIMKAIAEDTNPTKETSPS